MTRLIRHTTLPVFLILVVSAARADLVGLSIAPTSSGDLTAQGNLDWKLFGEGSGPGSLTANESKASGSGIGVLSTVGMAPIVNFSGFSASPDFVWTDGSPTSSSLGTAAMLAIRPTGEGAGFAFSVAAPVGVTQTLTVYTQAFRGTATLSADLTDGATVSATNSGSYTAAVGTGDNSGVFTIVYQAMTAGQTLDVSLLSSGVSGMFPSIGLGAVALSAVPEPSSFMLLGLVFAVGICGKRFRSRPQEG